ncbi:transporter substrate-binding domain-containing protein [Pseudoalteromonas sp. MMG010]|uniref:substrate-binding periplasmic protein n=1 Tax=Pseudoalteromonas sp. MMG010 TaxID=2822685 RepID=UPI001B39D75C|nr:transporter substrate-binding domain-containing protein [Pseudoalteromonas sp. MMG010]MBQ4834283.1 transporter substrate-binding domain-containing protein [Pseudoalteromonas sp. MMG010]
MLCLRVIVIMVSFALFSVHSYATNIINIAQEQRVQYKRDEYLLTLLEKALAEAKYSAEINQVLIHPHQQRTLIALDTKNLDLFWSMNSPERESLAIAIKIPLYKGFIGKRALLTKKRNLERFKQIKTVEQLAKLSSVQGHDWPDTKILAHNGLNVRPLANYQAMFMLTGKGRIDYFPRSFIEVGSELKANEQSDLVIVPNLFISYPTGFYYFVSKSKPELAAAVQRGLTAMINNGEFDALFNQYFADDIAALPYNSKVQEIKLDNPFY